MISQLFRDFPVSYGRPSSQEDAREFPNQQDAVMKVKTNRQHALT
jgi:hypothetical protein